MPDIFVSGESQKITKKMTSPSIKRTNKKNRKKVLDRVVSEALDKDVSKMRPSSLSAFCYYPKATSFVNEDKDEEIILLLRKHPITNLNWIFTAIFMILVPVFVSAFQFFVDIPVNFQIIFTLIWYLVTIGYMLEKFLSWFFHVNIITDERILEVDFHSLIYREMTDANIDQIQDVTVKIGGGIRTIFNYGNIQVQTAAEIPQLEFESVPEPDAVARILRELRVEEEQEKLEGRVR